MRRATYAQTRYLFDAEAAQVVGLSIEIFRRLIARSSRIPMLQHPGGRIAYELAAVRTVVAQSKKNSKKLKDKLP